MNISAWLLRRAGWSVDISVPDFPKCIICVAPHTSNWDFILGKLAYAAVGRRAGFLMKEAWFFWPLGYFFRRMGGIPVKRAGGDLVEQLTERFRAPGALTLAITPEGTRSRTSRWRTGFLRIAYAAEVPVVLGAIDFAKKRITIDTVFELTGDLDRDMADIKHFYKPFTGKYPEKFSTDPQ
ncbi:MAG: 1-acyl-sn-glycerol-3-phosphate acyltransferase [Muribaculaceae bacterium]|nr:1-acyl-sn-glycerol-3-phosphate acyltransferase [Muribaculaceae bacterium]